MEIHQLVHTLSYGDAISGEALALQSCFRAHGAESEIYAINCHPKYEGRARDYRALPSSFRGEVILHYSLGSPLNELYASLINSERTLVYHNITPAKWFRGVNPRVVRDIERGIGDLLRLCRMSDRLLADSRFNGNELRHHGLNCEVLELPVDPARWEKGANPGIRGLLARDRSFHLLHVGRLAPNKCVEDILKTFYFLHHWFVPQSRLWLVGIDTDTELYSFALKQMAAELRIDHAVTFTGGMSDEELRALYEGASAYICMSEHEGFCLPVVEAMYFGLPVVSFDAGALRDTLGTGGVLVSEKRHAEIAAILARISSNELFRQSLVTAGHHRAAELSHDRFREMVNSMFFSATKHTAKS